MKIKKIVVFYHADCPDGFGAAWAAWKKLGNGADYIPIKASKTPNQLGNVEVKNKDVYFLDTCASSERVRELVKNNKFVMVIDHHGTNRELVKNATQWHFDLNHSGSVLSWMYFHPKKPIPWLLRYIEDNDLWRFSLPNSIPVSLWLGLSRADFKTWERIARDLEKGSLRKKYIKEGILLLKHENAVIRGILEYAYEVKFKGYLARVANTSVSHSAVGNELIDKKHPIGITWYDTGDERKYSLRSRGALDVSKIAKQFIGGGGHKHAAGFTLPASKPFPWKIMKEK